MPQWHASSTIVTSPTKERHLTDVMTNDQIENQNQADVAEEEADMMAIYKKYYESRLNAVQPESNGKRKSNDGDALETEEATEEAAQKKQRLETTENLSDDDEFEEI
jgi:hypothetical protein